MEDHVVVTGASGAIGGAVAKEIRRRHPRARLTLVDRDEPASAVLAASLGGDAQAVGVDLADGPATDAAIARASERFGAPLGLVSAAGFMEVTAFERMDWPLAEKLLAVDLVAPLRMMHKAVPAMIEARRGFVVNVASMAGRVPLRGCAFYGAAKAGLAMASEIARRELVDRGVTIVTVYPGPVRSALEARARDQYGRAGVSRFLPTGDAPVLARRIVDAVVAREVRVIYPSIYGLGRWPLSGAIALAVGPSPRAS